MNTTEQQRLNIYTRRNRPTGFTLIEVMTSMAILLIMLGFLFSAFNQTTKAWLQGENRVETFQQARAALDMLGRELAQAMANTNMPFYGNSDSIAFIAPVSDNVSNVVDLMEVVYRLNYLQKGAADPLGLFNNTNNVPPFKLVRRATGFTNTVSACWDYGNGVTCGTASPYDFYTNKDWPETGDPSNAVAVAENVIRLGFEYVDIKTNLAINSRGFYWNSTPTDPVWFNEIGPNVGIKHTGGANLLYMTNRAPLGVRIYLDVIDSRGVRALQALLSAGPSATNTAAYKNIMTNNVHYFQTYVAIPNRQP